MIFSPADLMKQLEEAKERKKVESKSQRVKRGRYIALVRTSV